MSAKRSSGRRPNYHLIHAHPLPLITHPLPAFIPHNPLSILRIAYVIVSQYFFSPSPKRIKGHLSPETHSVHISDEESMRFLWEHGFFGKGTLSRSEPTWFEQEKKRRGVASAPITLEEVARERRIERQKFKMDRARKEQEALEAQQRLEVLLQDERQLIFPMVPPVQASSLMQVLTQQDTPDSKSASHEDLDKTYFSGRIDHFRNPVAQFFAYFQQNIYSLFGLNGKETAKIQLENKEYLQLTPEEAFFLSYGLGLLDIFSQESQTPISHQDLLQALRRSYQTNPGKLSPLGPDDPFLLRYVVYHHFRSLGWVVRPGIKFSADFLLYARGPAFTHAEFALVIVPSYSHAYWSETPERRVRARSAQKPYWWLHMTNRVQSHALKTLVYVYVDIPPPAENFSGRNLDFGRIFRSYRVREFIWKRWVPGRYSQKL